MRESAIVLAAMLCLFAFAAALERWTPLDGEQFLIFYTLARVLFLQRRLG